MFGSLRVFAGLCGGVFSHLNRLSLNILNGFRNLFQAVIRQGKSHPNR